MCSLCQTILNIYEIPYIYDSLVSLVFSVCYNIIKLNKNLKRIKLNKTNKTDFKVYIFMLIMHGSVLNSRPINIFNIPHKCSKNSILSNKIVESLAKSVSSFIGYLKKREQPQQSMNT